MSSRNAQQKQPTSISIRRARFLGATRVASCLQLEIRRCRVNIECGPPSGCNVVWRSRDGLAPLIKAKHRVVNVMKMRARPTRQRALPTRQSRVPVVNRHMPFLGGCAMPGRLLATEVALHGWFDTDLRGRYQDNRRDWRWRVSAGCARGSQRSTIAARPFPSRPCLVASSVCLGPLVCPLAMLCCWHPCRGRYVGQPATSILIALATLR